MTAEIAILNKTAVALAADSAVTLSLGTDQQKVYDSEDKLFELSTTDPIGIMINNNMHFMEAPLPVLIKRYRTAGGSSEKVADAARRFLEHLQKFGQDSPPKVRARGLVSALDPIWRVLVKRTSDKFAERISKPMPPEAADFSTWFNSLRPQVFSDQVAALTRAFETLPLTTAIGKRGRGATAAIREAIAELNIEHDAEFQFGAPTRAQASDLMALAKMVLSRRVMWSPHTGVIVAGFGQGELFPTLVSYEVYGMVEGELRIYQSNDIDIDRDGERAKVIPFAQKEMVDRFLYGLDEEIQRKITAFCREAVPAIRRQTLEALDMSDEDRADIESGIQAAEAAFLEGLRKETFDVIRAQSEREMNDMIEFMPKPEMARMAEALVNLTSIKRRVSRGMETVGGPIDCAVISQAEGFVWVKRKHYFPQELNSRYMERMRTRPTQSTKPTQSKEA